MQCQSIVPWNSGTIGIKIFGEITNPVYFNFFNNTFHNNTSHVPGSCISVHSPILGRHKMNSVFFFLESIKAIDNEGTEVTFKSLQNGTVPISLFYFTNVYITISGSADNPSIFSNNYGSVFRVLESCVTLQGYLYFTNNIANRGPAFMLEFNSVLYLMNELKANFINNTAQSVGGAIYASGDLFQNNCTFQHFNMSLVSNISLYFANNTATLAGDAIYSTNLYNCTVAGVDNLSQINIFYWKIFNNISQSDISSYASFLNFYNETRLRNGLYPGALAHIPVNILDRNGSFTYDILTVIPVGNKKMKKLDWKFSKDQGSTVIKGKDRCTIINLTIHTTDKSTFYKSSILLFTISAQNKVFDLKVWLNDCPIGFHLDDVKGICVCSRVFKHIKKFNEQKISCDIEKNAFSKPFDLRLWIGVTNRQNGRFGVAYCNPSYCNTSSQFDLLKVNKDGSYLLSSTISDTIPLCYGSRTGAFCGECIPNYSVVFGSTECKLCTSIWWPLTSIIYLLAGPLLVFLLYTFKLTLTTGTLNGIIFYAQTANIGIMRYLSMPCSDYGKESFFVKLSKLFIAWLNLNLGFPLCFYNGMTELWKAGLSLLFPIYLILIIAFLIILSHFSSRVSNKLSKSSVQVLVTIVHLSFTKLLEAVIDVFGSAKVYEEGSGEKIVWYNSGAVGYGSMEHTWLMIITSIIVGVILTPYFVLILFGKFLLKFDKFREYIRPFYEAIHAPYRTNRWYWFSLYQLFLLLLYLSETFAGNTGALFLVLFIIYNIFLYLQTCSMPFKSKALNLLNLSLLLVLNFVIIVGQYSIYSYSSKYLVLFFTFSNYYFVFVFCFIVLHHILLSTGQLDKSIKLCHKVVPFYRFINPTLQNHHYKTNWGDYPEVREPLLEQITD